MTAEITNARSANALGELKRPQKDLSAFWIGEDRNVESSVVWGRTGRIEQVWLTAISERGEARFVFCNQGSTSAYPMAPETSQALAHIYRDIISKSSTITERMSDLYKALTPEMMVGFWTGGIGDGCFALPDGLRSLTSIALMPTFECLVENPTLGRNLFAVSSPTGPVALYIDERENFSLIKYDGDVYRISTDGVANSELRKLTFELATTIVDGREGEFVAKMANCKVDTTWSVAGGPSARMVLATPGSGSIA